MRERNVKKQFFISDKENEILELKSKKAGLNQSEFIRQYINGYEVKEKPDANFYYVLRNLNGIATNINQIAKNANRFEYVDESKYNKNYQEILQFIDDIKTVYLEPRKVGGNK